MSCLQCDPYQPGNEDTVTGTPEDAARFERHRAQDLADDDRPDPSDVL